MANDTKKPVEAAPVDDTPADDFAQWAAEARRKASSGPANLVPGSVIDPDPRLHYAVLDGDCPTSVLDRQKAYHVALGFREVPNVKVLNYRNPVVMAIPADVYRDVVRRARVDDIGRAMKKWGGMSFYTANSVTYS